MQTISWQELATRVALDDERLIDPALPLLVAEGRPLSAVSSAVASLPAVLVAVGAHVERADVVVADDTELAVVAEAVRRTPLAAVAMALLLRGRDGRSLHQALVAESTTYSMLQGGPEFAAWRAGRPAKERASGTGDAVVVERDGDLLRVTLNRPWRHNAYSVEVRDGLVEALRLAAADPSTRVELRGAGPSFCSGGDLDEFGTFPDPVSSHTLRLTRSAARLLVEVGARTTAHVHGACLGAGVELPAFCGRVVARPDAVFGLPELSLGLVPGAGGTASMPPRIGRHRTMWLALTGARIDATAALSWGLVDAIA